MKRVLIALLLVACHEGTTAPPAPPPDIRPSWWAVLDAVDSLNASIRQLYRDGGKVTHVYFVSFPADTTIAPVVAVQVVRP